MGSVPNFDHIHEDIYEPLSPSLGRTTTSDPRPPPKLPAGYKGSLIRVAVCGGGIGGLCVALGLFQLGHMDVHIYEAAHKFSEIGAGIGIGPNAERALELLGPHVYAAYASQATKCPFRMCNGMKGPDEGKDLMPADNGVSQSTIHRANFLDALVALVPPERAHFGKRLLYIEDKTSQGGCFILHFKDETTAEADAVIGADGIHSHVRNYILDDTEITNLGPTYSGATAYRNLIPMEKAVATLGAEISQNNCVFMLNGSMIMSYPVDHHQRLNVVAYTWKYKTWDQKDWVVPVEKTDVINAYHGQEDMLTKMLELFERPSAWALWDLPSLPRYNRGRVCIVGDAAHAPTPFQGQGAGQAIEDALVVTRLLSNVKTVDELPAAFAAYDAVRRPRGNKNVVASRQAGRITSLQDPEHQDMEQIAKDFPPRMVWCWSKDMRELCGEAVDLFNKNKPQD